MAVIDRQVGLGDGVIALRGKSVSIITVQRSIYPTRQSFTNQSVPKNDEDETDLEERLRKIGEEGPDEETIKRMKGNIKEKVKELEKKRKANGDSDQ